MPGTTQSKTPSATSPISVELAHAIGCDCANEWLNRSFGDASSVIPCEAAAWRARCYADAVHTYQDLVDFLRLLSSWEHGFDSTMSAATARPIASTELQHDIIKRLAGNANTVAALLSVVEILPAEGRQAAMSTCHAIASDIVDDLDKIFFAHVGGAA